MQKSTKKLKFTASLKHFFNFVPRGTNVNNFFVRKTTLFYFRFKFDKAAHLMYNEFCIKKNYYKTYYKGGVLCPTLLHPLQPLQSQLQQILLLQT